MDTDSRHQFIKKKLELLGYSQTLPVAAISLVSSLIDDLIQTSESLKVAKDEIQELEEQKHAWELVVEPYKCDNSKLLSECNKLKLDLLNSEKKIQIENSGKSK